MRRQSTPPLPRWARITRKKDEKETALSMEQEEFYLRTRMHQTMCRRVDEALQTVLESRVSPIVKDIMAFFKMASPHDNGDSAEQRSRKRARPAEQEDPLLSLFEMTPSEQYPATMLPIAVLNGPPSFLDRHEMMHCMVNEMKQEQREERPAVCWLRSTGNSSIRHCGTFLQEILRQCIAQEPNPTQFQRLFAKTRLSNSSFSHALLMWAQYTVSFDSIVVFIDTVECIPGPLFQDFLGILTQLRSDHGLPLKVVLLAPPGRTHRLGLDSSAQGTVGILVRDFSLPTSKVLFDCIWEQVFIERPLPVSLAPSVLRSLHECFDHHHSSAVRATQMLKQALAHGCIQRGAFLMGKDEPLFAKDEKRRINYFHSHHHSDETLKFAEDASTEQAVLSTIMRLLHRIGVDVGGEALSGVAWAEQEFSTFCFNSIRSRICRYFSGLNKSEKMAWLADLRKELQSSNRAVVYLVTDQDDRVSVPNSLRELLSQLDEIIVLTEKAEAEEEGTFAKDLSELVSEWFYNASIVGAAIQAGRRDDSNRFSPTAAKADSTVDAFAPQVRGQLTDALLTPSRVLDKSDFRALAPCTLFSLMQDRVVISREECFEAFVKSFNGGPSLEDLCSAFAFGMHQLCYCGLVNEKRGSKNNILLYERTALVWCSGR